MQQQLNIKLGEDDLRVLDAMCKREKPARTRTAMARHIVLGALAAIKEQMSVKRGRRAGR